MADNSEPVDYSKLIKQIQLEYALCWDNQQARIVVGLERLALYNNQKRDKSLVGDPLLFTVHQTVLASLYNDRLGVSFLGREDGDDETGDNLTSMAQFDYETMQKDVLDYYWDWDASFFGRGIVKLYEFNRDKRFNCPIPELFDPMTFLRDPKAISIAGDIKGRGAMRFGGREIELSKRETTEDRGYFDIKNLRAGEEVKSLIKQANEARDKAAGLDNIKNASEAQLGDSEKINALEWYTYFNGEKVCVTLANSKSKVIKIDKTGETFGLIDRPMYPNAHSWEGVSVPDLVEDKQRHRSVVINLALQGVKADQYPAYLYDETRIKNKADLTSIKMNKYVGVQGEGDIRGAVAPMNKPLNSQAMANWILQTLDASVQRATATPEMQQGAVSDEKRTLGELNLISSKVDTRYSLTAKVFGWSERAFWQQWYRLYKEHMADGGVDEKVVRIAGSMGNKFRKLTKENITFTIDPDIKIESKTVAENMRLKDRTLLNGFAPTVVNSPNAIGKKYFERKLAHLNGLEPDEVNIVYPPTVDELIAQDENDKFLSENKPTMVSPDDNDYEHLQIHSKAAETAAKAAHILAHKTQLMLKRRQPELFSPKSLQTSGNGAVKTPAPGMPGETAQPNLGTMTPSATAAAGNAMQG